MPIKLRVLSPLHTHIEGDFPYKVIDQALSFLVEGAQFHRAHIMWKRSGGKYGWDGRTHLLNRTSTTFPTGLLPRVLDILGKLNLPSQVIRVDDIEVNGKPRELHAKLRPYQEEAVAAALHFRRGVICAPTGSGKTLTVIAIAAKLGIPALILVHTKGLVAQWHDAVQEYLKCSAKDVLVFQGGRWQGKASAQIVIASLSSLVSKKISPENLNRANELFKRTQLLVADECHHASAKTFLKVISAVPAVYRIGVSATPYDRQDASGILLEGYFGPVIYTAQQDKLVDDGHLAQGMVAFIDCNKPDDLDSRKRLTYAEAYKAGVVYNDHRNGLLVRAMARQVKLKKRVLCLVKEIAHGWKLLRMAEEYIDENRMAYVTAATPANIIKELLKEFGKGNLDVIIASPVFGEGIDIPSADVVVIADSGKSVIGTTQKIGRGTRTNRGTKDRFLVIDVLDLTHAYLINHSEKRIAIYEKIGLTFLDNPRDAWATT